MRTALLVALAALLCAASLADDAPPVAGQPAAQTDPADPAQAPEPAPPTMPQVLNAPRTVSSMVQFWGLVSSACERAGLPAEQVIVAAECGASGYEAAPQSGPDSSGAEPGARSVQVSATVLCVGSAYFPGLTRELSSVCGRPARLVPSGKFAATMARGTTGMPAAEAEWTYYWAYPHMTSLAIRLSGGARNTPQGGRLVDGVWYFPVSLRLVSGLDRDALSQDLIDFLDANATGIR